MHDDGYGMLCIYGEDKKQVKNGWLFLLLFTYK